MSDRSGQWTGQEERLDGGLFCSIWRRAPRRPPLHNVPARAAADRGG
ncbi:hypothetical protein RKD31_004502 [Streptomyces sp. SAI-163]